jgi:hypothetical protein
MQYKDAIF